MSSERRVVRELTNDICLAEKIVISDLIRDLSADWVDGWRVEVRIEHRTL